MSEKDVHIIDCDAPPFIPHRWTVAEIEHQAPGRVTGKFTWAPEKVALHLDPDQLEQSVVGTDLIKRLAGKKVLPAHVLDCLLAHPELIPEEWKEKLVFFWGTVYRRPGGDLWVRCLYWGGGRWHWDGFWLDDGWGFGRPAAVLIP